MEFLIITGELLIVLLIAFLFVLFCMLSVIKTIEMFISFYRNINKLIKWINRY